MNNPSPLIHLDTVTKTYHMGDTILKALNRVSFTIEQGEYVSILGPSGSGKSTVMNIIGCLDTPDSGHYRLDGQNVSQLSRSQLAIIRNKKIGFVFQKFNLLEYATALENTSLPLIYRGVNTAQRDQQARSLLDAVNLTDRIHHKPSELSGGQQQRVAIARALITDPDIILADEPTGNLDSQSGNEVIALFEQCVAKGKTVIIVTHDLEMAERTNRVIRIRDGQVQQQ